MKNKKSIIIVIAIIIAYLVLAVIFFGWEEFINRFRIMNIMVSNGDKLQLKNGVWEDLKNPDDYNWNKFSIYVDNKFIGKYDVLYNNRWYLFDDNRKAVKYKGNILAINGNVKYEVIDFTEESFDSDGERLLMKILEEKNIDETSKPNSTSKIVLDVDGDGFQETFYMASNAFIEGFSVKNRYSIIFTGDEQPEVLYEHYEDESMQFSMCVPRINSVIDIDKDSKYELIFECNYYDLLGSCSMLYELNNGKYELRKSC